jgi:hypothetical protein
MIDVDFLGIGVQKSATSWLFDNLRDHPDIWMPPRKELHYFDRSINYLSPSFLATDKYIDRVKGTDEHNILFRRKMDEELGFAIKTGNIKNANWLRNYFCQDISDNWYRSLFFEGKGKIKGEITPAYSILSVEDIRHIKQLFPDLKIILLLRDPVERAWSQLKFLTKKDSFKTPLTKKKIIEFIDSSFQVSRGDYYGIISRWRSVFSSDQLFTGYYDEVIKSPKQLLSKLFSFLNVDPEDSSFEHLHKKSNVSPFFEMPEEVKEYLIAKYTDEVIKLLSIHPSYHVERWLREYQSYK